MDDLLTKFYEIIAQFGFKFIIAILILIIGKLAVNSIKKLLVKVMDKKEIDKTITTFTASLLKAVLWVFVILMALSQLGIQTTSFIAVLGAAGLAVGLALQGSLANFAAGFLIILFRPFKVGDVVESGNVIGVVNAINIFNSDFKTFDNKRIIVPNSQIMNSNITNYTAENTRRVDLVLGVDYKSDINKVKSIINELIEKHEMILKDPLPTVRLAKMADSSLNFNVRVWTKTEDYWPVFYDLTEQAKEAFDQNNINIPYPQMDVHLKQ